MKKVKKRWVAILCSCLLVVIIVFAASLLMQRITFSENRKTEVITVPVLEKVINVSELSTFTAVYNGVAKVMNEENPNEIDYYVSYEAKVKAGVNFDDVSISIDQEKKNIVIKVPRIDINEIFVDIGSLDYIFVNNNANEFSVSQEAFKACEIDVKKESEQQEEIYELAEQNARNILTALIRPLVEQLDEEFNIVVE